MRTKTLVATVVAMYLLSGCAEHNKAPVTSLEQKVITPAPKEKLLNISTVAMPVRKLIKSICLANNLSWDNSYEPSDKYKITVNFNGTISELFTLIKRQTGVSYKLTDGMITLENRDEVTQFVHAKKNQDTAGEINISWKDTPVRDAFKYFYDHFGYSFVFDMRFTTLQTSNFVTPSLAPVPQIPVLNQQGQAQNLPAGKKEIKTVNFFYTGSDPREALSSFMKSLDFAAEETSDKTFSVKDHELAMIDKSVFFDYSLARSGSGSASSTSTNTGTSSTTSTGSVSSEETATVSITEKHKDTVEAYLRRYASPDGKLDFSNRGYIIVMDHPSFVENIKKIVKKEEEKETPLAIGINIVRVDLKDDYKAGVDWNAVWNKGLFGLRDLRVSSSMTGLVNGGFTITGAFKGTDQVLSVLQEFGETKIETSRTLNVRSGFLEHFDNVKPIPYIATTSTITGGTSSFAQGSITPLAEEEGVTLNILPNINLEKNIVDLGINVVVAEYVGDKSFDQGVNGIYTIPIVTKDRGKFAGQVRIGDTVILTGFKVHKKGNTKKGIPGFSQIPFIGSLFGYQADLDETSEILIMIKVDKGV